MAVCNNVNVWWGERRHEALAELTTPEGIKREGLIRGGVHGVW